VKRAGIRIFLVFAGLLLFYVAGVLVRGHYGIRVLVKNQSGGTLKNVILKEETRGPPDLLGDIGTGVQKCIFVRPKTESHVVLEFLDAAKVAHSEVGLGSLESGYCGSANVIIQPRGIVNVTEPVDVLFCKGS
jgi:hypothetical protein